MKRVLWIGENGGRWGGRIAEGVEIRGWICGCGAAVGAERNKTVRGGWEGGARQCLHPP